MITTHTPGPWAVSKRGCDQFQTHAIIEAANDFPRVAVICSGESANDPPHFSRDEAEANARLIAAAPEMLAALKRLCSDPATYDASDIRICCDSHSDAIARMIAARAAIAKAEGAQ